MSLAMLEVMENAVDWLRASRLAKSLSRGQLQKGLFFMGNPRSGTTLVRSLLDAHPMVVLSNELNAMKLMENGHSWQSVLRQILQNSIRFKRAPVWTGYSYSVQYGEKDSPAMIRVIGDKKAGYTTKMIRDDSTVIMRFLQWVPLPVTFVHCIRHPMDVIATKSRCNQRSIVKNMKTYFNHEAAVAFASRVVGQKQIIRVYLEDLIHRPEDVMRSMLTVLELPVDETYLHACASAVNPATHETRHQIRWSSEMIEEMEKRMAAISHLKYYLKNRTEISDP